LDDARRHRRLMTLLDEHGTRLHAALVRLTLRHDVAADLLQELFLRLEHSDAFAAAEDAGGYAWRTAINLATEWRRSRAREKAQQSMSERRSPMMRHALSPLDQLVHEEQVTRVLDGLGGLRELTRTCFVLRFIEQQSYQEIGDRLSKTPHQVRGLCHAAVRQLRAHVLDDDERSPDPRETTGHV
jgi:RNA polymerase sigma factor (sigma-70 family)